MNGVNNHLTWEILLKSTNNLARKGFEKKRLVISILYKIVIFYKIIKHS